MRVEVLTDPNMVLRGERMLRAMVKACPFPVDVHQKYEGKSDILMVYGTGHPERRPWWNAHIKAGRTAIGWDLGYWHRKDGTMRMTMNADHPHAMLRRETPARWESAGIELREDFKADGRIIVVGMSRKAVKIHGMPAWSWEMRQLRALSKMHPQREVWFKPKRDTDPTLPGFRTWRGTIEEALRGASLVVCRHSNVAVDACIAGVPVQCEDGAAYALYRDNPQPDRNQRLSFLHGLAHWQYTPTEAEEAWNYIRARLSV